MSYRTLSYYLISEFCCYGFYVSRLVYCGNFGVSYSLGYFSPCFESFESAFAKLVVSKKFDEFKQFTYI